MVSIDIYVGMPWLFLSRATIHYRTRIPSATYKNGDQDQVNLFVDSCVFNHSSAALNQVSRLLKAALTSHILSYKWQLTLRLSFMHNVLALSHRFKDTYAIRSPQFIPTILSLAIQITKLEIQSSISATHSSQIRNFPRDEPPRNDSFSSL